ncbi:EamA-like transporter family protein [Cyclonatronum proteinivorum]|uniref:EamA-like transporter family protein n=1 Tax=Cyclonatronum proteinivorum TaxID=1457365 RepID=A0A345UK41_9BACT|nr:EamA family transporter [Cyclonatronum proteinivorum]AXJ00843.1 EamA-like transporter family protein [Cyclonatronum proteinivorum]
MGIVLILLSVGCSVLLANLLKLGELRRYSILNVLTVNYAVAFSSALVLNVRNEVSLWPDFPLWFWFFCAFIGFIFIANFFLFSRSVHQNGLGVSIAAMRMSLLLPLLLAVVLYGEALTLSRVTGILLVFGALYLLISGRVKLRLTQVSSAGLLLLIFIFSGTADASLKIFEEEMSAVASEAHLMSAIFFFSLLIGIATSLRQGQLQQLSRSEVMLGAGVGIPNLFSSVFLIQAFAWYDASVVYAVVNMLVVAGGALTGYLFWKDDITRKELAGIALALAAILLLVVF